MAGHRRTAGGALATLALLTCLGITAPQAFADIGTPDLLEPTSAPATADPALVTDPVVEADGDAPIPSETTATVDDALSAPVGVPSEPTSQPSADEPDDAAIPAAPDVSDDAEGSPAGASDPIGGTVSVPSVDAVDASVDTADTADDTAGSGVDTTATPEVVGSVDIGSVEGPLDPILDTTAPLTGSFTDTRESIDAIQSTATDTFETGSSAASDVTDTVTLTIADAGVPAGIDPAVERTVDDLTEAIDVVSQVVQDVVADASGTPSGAVGGLVDAASTLVVGLTESVSHDIAAALHPALEVSTDVTTAFDTTVAPVVDSVIAATGDITAASDPIVETGIVGDAVGSVGDPVGDAVGSVGDPVGDAVGSVGDPVGDAVGSVGDAVGSVDDAVGSVDDPVGDAVGSVDDPVGDAVGSVSESWSGITNAASTTEPTRSVSPARGSSYDGWGSTIAMQRDPRTRWNGDAVDTLAAVSGPAAPEIQNASACPIESTLLCSLTIDLVELGSLVDTLTSIVRILALTGASLLPWIGTGLLFAAIGALALMAARRRSTAVRSPADLGPDSWAYPEVVG